MLYDLECRYDSRKSFYGKAKFKNHVDMQGNVFMTELYSYGTLVAKIEYYYYKSKLEKTVYEYFGKYSQTTTRHQKEFFKQNGLSWKEIDELFKNGILEVELCL